MISTNYKEQLRVIARKLGGYTDTDWAYEHEDVYERFDTEIKRLHENGDLTDAEFCGLALTAFYDYDIPAELEYVFDEGITIESPNRSSRMFLRRNAQ